MTRQAKEPECRVVESPHGGLVKECNLMFPQNHERACRRLDQESDTCMKGFPVDCSCYWRCKENHCHYAEGK